MARGNGPGKDFDDQFNQSKRRAAPKVERGEGPWSQDKYLRDMNSGSSTPPSSGGCLMLFGLLLALGLAIAALTGCAAQSDYDQCNQAFQKHLTAVLNAESAQEVQRLGAKPVPAACERLDENDRDRLVVENSDLMNASIAHQVALESEFPA